jgi:hypothetical protein
LLVHTHTIKYIKTIIRVATVVILSKLGVNHHVASGLKVLP